MQPAPGSQVVPEFDDLADDQRGEGVGDGPVPRFRHGCLCRVAHFIGAQLGDPLHARAGNVRCGLYAGMRGVRIRLCPCSPDDSAADLGVNGLLHSPWHMGQRIRVSRSKQGIADAWHEVGHMYFSLELGPSGVLGTSRGHPGTLGCHRPATDLLGLLVFRRADSMGGMTNRPEWLKDAPELAESLLKVREVGVWDLRLNRLAIEPLETVARAICPSELHNDQQKLIECALKQAILQIERQDYRNAAICLFDLGETRVKSPTERRAKAAEACGQSSSQFRRADVGYERPVILEVARVIQELAVTHSVPPAADSLARLDQLGILPEELVITRSLLHVARTLERRSRHATETAKQEIDGLLERYANWHANKQESGATILKSFDALCRKYLDISVFELLGHLEGTSPGPDNPPQKPMPRLQYPSDDSLALIPGGRDVFTGEHVRPFYMAYFPVTMLEWWDFLEKTGWTGIGHWTSIDTFPANLLFVGATRPAVSMTYFDCLGYCFWLWLTTPYRFRLPTESEWNFAATGGEAREYPWGNEVDYRLANIARPGTQGTEIGAVDAVPPSGPFNIAGLSGNVWEYVSTLWRGDTPVPDSDIDLPDLVFPLIAPGWWTVDDRLSVTSNDFYTEVKFVMKGGSWSLGAKYATVDTRIYASFINSGEYGGFRLAVDAVLDPNTGQYAPESSPFIHQNLREVRSLNANDMRQLLGDYLMEQALATASSSSCPTGIPLTNEPARSWEEIVRKRFAKLFH